MDSSGRGFFRGRRNLSAAARTLLALKLEESIKARAKAKQIETLKKGDAPVKQNSAERDHIETREELAKLAGVSRVFGNEGSLRAMPHFLSTENPLGESLFSLWR